MLILHTHTISKTTYNVYMGSSGNKFIFNVAETTQSKPTGGYGDLKYICSVKGFEDKDIQPIIVKAERIMGKKLKENLVVKN